MNFESHLIGIITHQFDTHRINYDGNRNASYLAARYLEMLNRRIVPIPRQVLFSKEICDSLGNLTRETKATLRKTPAEAWGSVFLIRHLLAEGKSVNGFLSKSIDSATGKRSRDGLLWDFGLHHFHLSKQVDASGFVKRSDYLLFAIITQENAYFVDVRPHDDPENLGWVRQDLLRIVHSNWPELIERQVLRGVKGNRLTDEQKKELRRKNINHVTERGDDAIAPIGGGMMADGSSLLCRWWGLKLLHEINDHQSYFDRQPAELRSRLEAKGVKIAGRMEFQLVLLESLSPSAEIVASLTADQCLSRDLSRMGFAIVEATTRLPIVVSLENQP